MSTPASATPLVSSIPTEVVAPYTAAVALVVGLINEAKKQHYPDQFRTLRWGMLGALLFITAVSVVVSHRAKNQARWPIPETAAAVLAAAIWGLSLPDSPLIPSLHGDNKTLVPGLIILGAGTLLVAAANVLTKPTSKKLKEAAATSQQLSEAPTITQEPASQAE